MIPAYLPNFASVTEEQIRDVSWGVFTEARQECFMANEVMHYTYGSGRGIRTYTSMPFVSWVDDIMSKLNKDGHCYNVCFLNRYDNEHQHLGWHSDNSHGMDHEHPIAVVSFGEAREIWWRSFGEKGIVPPGRRQLLENGSLFVMPAGFQRLYQHRIPKGDCSMGRRISLTFRHFIKDQL